MCSKEIVYIELSIIHGFWHPLRDLEHIPHQQGKLLGRIIIRFINVQRRITGDIHSSLLGTALSIPVFLAYLLKASFTQKCPFLNNKLCGYPSYRCYFMGTLTDLIDFECHL